MKKEQEIVVIDAVKYIKNENGILGEYGFSFEDDPGMVWTGEPVEDCLCDICLNRFPDGKCEEHSMAEMSVVIDTNNCPDFLQDPYFDDIKKGL